MADISSLTKSEILDLFEAYDFHDEIGHPLIHLTLSPICFRVIWQPLTNQVQVVVCKYEKDLLYNLHAY